MKDRENSLDETRIRVNRKFWRAEAVNKVGSAYREPCLSYKMIWTFIYKYWEPTKDCYREDYLQMITSSYMMFVAEAEKSESNLSSPQEN